MAELGFFDEPSDSATVPDDVRIKHLEQELDKARKDLAASSASAKKDAFGRRELEGELDALRRTSAAQATTLRETERRLVSTTAALEEAQAAGRAAREEVEDARRAADLRGRRATELEAALDSSAAAATADAAAHVMAERVAEQELDAAAAELEAVRGRARAELAAREAEIAELRQEVSELAGGSTGGQGGANSGAPDVIALEARCAALPVNPGVHVCVRSCVRAGERACIRLIPRLALSCCSCAARRCIWPAHRPDVVDQRALRGHSGLGATPLMQVPRSGGAQRGA
jgi:hypothetical protein